MNLVSYFAYGSNLDADQMRERCPSSQALARARLDDHRLDFTHWSRRWRGGAADVIREPGATVWGVVYRLCTDDLERLDRFEGGYARIQVRVEDASGARHEALSYSVREKSSHAPCPAYLARMVDWGERWGLPESYLEDLRRRAPR
ncbi:MAG: gamma-glutamylcyclotransferase [Deltaproteobacteria bacterium]|nr:gamma-glutamylcyclotransferase [Deltaproteobacteria bacterium]